MPMAGEQPPGAGGGAEPHPGNLLVAVGFRAYEHLQELPRAIDDVEAVTERFRRSGFSTKTMPDQLREDLVRALHTALPKDGLSRPDTALVVYWCGHATADGGVGGTVRLLARGNRADAPMPSS